MARYEGPHTALTIELHIGLSLAIIFDSYKGPHSSLKIASHRGLYLAIIMAFMKGPHYPYYSLA
jgi:hypothetical protein